MVHACVFRTCAASTEREEAGWDIRGEEGEEEGWRGRGGGGGGLVATHTTKNVDVERSED